MIEWLAQYIKSLANKPDQVSASLKEGEITSVISITVANEDLPLLEGSNNRITRALNQVAQLAGAKDRTRYLVKVSD